MKNDGDTQVEDCEECNKKFDVTMNVDVTYTTRGLCEENKVKHNWEHFDYTTDDNESLRRTKGKKCVTCDKYEFDLKNKEKSYFLSLASLTSCVLHLILSFFVMHIFTYLLTDQEAKHSTHCRQ